MTLSFVFRNLTGGGPSQAKGGIWVLKSLTGVGIRLTLRALELGNAWTAIIMDTHNGEDCYPLSGQRLWCGLYRQVTTPTASSLARKLSWQGFKGLTLRFDSRQEPSMTLVLAAVHIEVMREKNVPLP